jgi:ATP-dependent RNA helicase SUPV3L1/SUV3
LTTQGLTNLTSDWVFAHGACYFFVQLIGDQQRGFAWSRALLGLPANIIHVCGDTSAVGVVRHLAKLCGDEFELHSYER